MNRFLALLLALFSALAVHAASDVSVSGSAFFEPLQAPFESQIFGRVFNNGPDASGPLKMRITAPAPLQLEPRPREQTQLACAPEGASIVCTHPGLDPQKSDAIPLRVFASAIDAGRYDIVYEVEAADDPQPENNRNVARGELYHLFGLTSDADSGPGTLRDAIERANALCRGDVTCYIRPLSGGFTYRPATPLPALTACNLILTTGSQIYYGPRMIELDGSLLRSGNGLEVRTACPAGTGGVYISGVAIGGFPENGIDLATQDEDPSRTCHTIADSIIGLDFNGLEPRPNGLRGISIGSPKTCVGISHNYIGGNRASGISVWAAARVGIFQNHIGWGEWTRPKPNGNGASGIYIGSDEVAVAGNNIAFNGQFGIAVAPWVRRPGVRANVIHSNGGKAIDWALDGDTPNDPDESDGIPNAPQITSIRRVQGSDGQPRMVISGLLRSRTGVFGERFFIRFYLNGGPGLNGRFEAFQPFTTIQVQPNAEGLFEVAFETVPFHPLRSGTMVTAQLNVSEGDSLNRGTTSELSAPVPVP
jgi:hypothetical protein